MYEWPAVKLAHHWFKTSLTNTYLTPIFKTLQQSVSNLITGFSNLYKQG
jgi:hypothetical protein